MGLKYKGGFRLRDKLSFYIALYEQLALKGFQAYADHSNEHISMICVNGNNIAYLTREDSIEPNPYAEVDAGTIDTLREIARNTALMFNLCTEKPYDETKHEQMPDGSYKLAVLDDTALTCRPHPWFNYVFAISGQSSEADESNFYFSKADAARDFAVKSNLINEWQIFTNDELSTLHSSLVDMRIKPDNNLNSQETAELDTLISKIENIVPTLGDVSTAAEHENDAEQGV